MSAGRAWFSDDDVYRYALTRLIDPLLGSGTVNFILLNPSTADAEMDDPTVRRVKGFARACGYQTAVVTNLFAYRATLPPDLKRVTDPVGPENDAYIRKIADAADLIVVAWGTHGAYRSRDAAVLTLLRETGKTVHCLGTSKDGHPRHPLYLRADLQPMPFAALPAADAARAVGEGA